MQKEYRIHTRWLAYELRKSGFKIIGTDINKYHPQFEVWIFDDTPELHQKIVQLTSDRKKR